MMILTENASYFIMLVDQIRNRATHSLLDIGLCLDFNYQVHDDLGFKLPTY